MGDGAHCWLDNCCDYCKSLSVLCVSRYCSWHDITSIFCLFYRISCSRLSPWIFLLCSFADRSWSSHLVNSWSYFSTIWRIINPGNTYSTSCNITRSQCASWWQKNKTSINTILGKKIKKENICSLFFWQYNPLLKMEINIGDKLPLLVNSFSHRWWRPRESFILLFSTSYPFQQKQLPHWDEHSYQIRDEFELDDYQSSW